MNRGDFMAACEGVRFLITSWSIRHADGIRHERAHEVYLLRCAWADLTAPLRPHARCWLCGAFCKRWWKARPCECDESPCAS